VARVKGSLVRTADRSIDPLFVDRWSPRAMSGEPITRDELFQLFEAARWAPSSGNSQPWRMLYAHRDGPHWPTFFGLLASGNQVWCVNAAVLVVFVVFAACAGVSVLIFAGVSGRGGIVGVALSGFFALSAGWAVRNRLWPKDQFA